jgi:predicted component of type VI protein secretion system
MRALPESCLSFDVFGPNPQVSALDLLLNIRADVRMEPAEKRVQPSAMHGIL